MSHDGKSSTAHGFKGCELQVLFLIKNTSSETGFLARLMIRQCNPKNSYETAHDCLLWLCLPPDRLFNQLWDADCLQSLVALETLYSNTSYNF